MEAWRHVEVAACEEMDGPTDADLEAIRAATFTVEAVQRARGDHRPRRRRLRRRAQRERPASRALDPLRADVLRRPRHRARRCSCARPASMLVLAGARELVGGAGRAGARARRHGLRRAHARRPRRADDVRRQARRLRDGGRTATPSACERAFAPGRGRRDLGRGRHLLGARRRTFERARARAARPRAPSRSPRRSSPRDRHAELLQAIALAGAGPRALRDGDPPPAAHRGPRGRGAVPHRARRARARCRTSATRSRPSASPASRASCAATRRPASRTSRCGTSATSRTPAPSA